MFSVCNLQYSIFEFDELHTLWQEQLEFLHFRNAGGFSSRYHWLIYNSRFFLRVREFLDECVRHWLLHTIWPYVLSFPYLSCFLYECRERDVLHEHKMDYRNDDILLAFLEFLQKIIHTIRDGRPSFSPSSEFYRNLADAWNLSIPNNVDHYKKNWIYSYRPSPKIVQHHLCYTLPACQTSSLICQSPTETTVRGTFSNYNTG